jgi:hypothetical protein
MTTTYIVCVGREHDEYTDPTDDTVRCLNCELIIGECPRCYATLELPATRDDNPVCEVCADPANDPACDECGEHHDADGVRLDGTVAR